MPRILNRIQIARDIGDVFAFVTTPVYWPRWHPSTLVVRGSTDHSLRLGDQVIEEFGAFGLRHRVDWKVIECAPPTRWAVVGHRSDGGDARLAYTFAPSSCGTLVEGLFVYRMAGLWFSLIDGLVVRKRLIAESREAVQRLKLLLEQECSTM